jgi:hypothetical protein
MAAPFSIQRRYGPRTRQAAPPNSHRGTLTAIRLIGWLRRTRRKVAMVLDSLIEFVKFFGGLGGLASSSFLVYDRLFRFRPSAFLIPVEYKTSIRFQNVAAETIIIDKVVIRPSQMLKLARANDLATKDEEKAAAWYNTGNKKLDDVFIIIKPMGERTFALHRFAEFESADGGTTISIQCRWRNTRKPFLMSRYVQIKTTVKEIHDLREASLAGKA